MEFNFRMGIALLVLLALPGPGRPVPAQENNDGELPRPQLHDPTPTPGPGFAEGRAQPRIFTWADGRQLILRVPPAWEAETDRGPKGSLALEIRPRSGSLFSFVIDAIPLTYAEIARMQGEGLRLLAQNNGERMLPQARESSIRLERLLGDAGQGYLYSITDSRAVVPSGEYRYMTAGVYLAGDLLLVPSLVHNDASGAVKTQMMEVLRSAHAPGAE